MNSVPIWLTAFVDETGNHDLEITKDGASNLFICVAVVVNDDQSKLVEERMREISRDEFSNSEVKSSGIGGNHNRRLKILNKIKDLSFGYYALVINKSEVERDSGLKYKPVFYKYLNLMLYNRLLGGGTNLHIVADAIGGRPFMDSFLPYLEQKGKPDLFTDWDHKFVPSDLTPQVQLSDLIAGTLAWCFDSDKICEHSASFRELLKPNEIAVDSWPPKFRSLPETLPHEQDSELWDDHIHNCSVKRASRFIDEHDDREDEDVRMQVAALRHLLFLREYESSDTPQNIISDQLILHLQQQGFPMLTRQQLSSSVIGPLRSAGIFISGGSDGYRLACNIADIRRYLIHDTNIIRPMLARLKVARTGILQDTSSRYDVLKTDDFSFLRVLVDAISDHDLREALKPDKYDEEEVD